MAHPSKYRDALEFFHVLLIALSMMCISINCIMVLTNIWRNKRQNMAVIFQMPKIIACKKPIFVSSFIDLVKHSNLKRI